MSPLHRKLAGAGVAVAAFALAVGLWNSPRVCADELRADASIEEAARILRGFAIAPVPLNLQGKDPALVGLGSYLVNTVGACNDCHTQPPYAPGGNPYLGQPKKINASTYLGGGATPLIPFVIPRNLTPDKTGRPEGGRTFTEFSKVMRTGIDLDNAHPLISPLLQAMPWPLYQDMSDHDLRAMYEYLSAIPCVEGGPGEPANRCNNPPFGIIDTPKENELVTAGSWASGWALDDSGVALVTASLENGPAIPALIGQPFPGVKAAYPGFPNAGRAGFGFPIPVGAAGPHVLTVTITANDGGKTALTRHIQIK